jgi:hypothetical protein
MNIALLGEIGSGKTAVAKKLGTQLGFADALRLEVAWMLAGAESRDFITRNHQATVILVRHFHALMTSAHTKDTYRDLQQTWGSMRRAEDPDYWVKLFLKAYEKHKGDAVVVVDDCRYPNEYKALKNLGFKFVLLEAGETTRELTPTQAAHESEKYWRKFKTDLTLPYDTIENTAAAALAKFTPAEAPIG